MGLKWVVRSESEFVFVSGFVSEPVHGPEFGSGSGSGCMVLSLSDGIIKLRLSLQSKYFLRYFFTIARRLFREIVRIPCSLGFCSVGGGLWLWSGASSYRVAALLSFAGVWRLALFQCEVLLGAQSVLAEKISTPHMGWHDVVMKEFAKSRTFVAYASGTQFASFLLSI